MVEARIKEQSFVTKTQLRITELEKLLETERKKLIAEDSPICKYELAEKELQEANRICRIAKADLDEANKYYQAAIEGRVLGVHSPRELAILTKGAGEQAAKRDKEFWEATAKLQEKQSVFSKLDRDVRNHQTFKQFHAEQQQIFEYVNKLAEESWTTASVTQLPVIIAEIESLASQERTLCAVGNSQLKIAGLPAILVAVIGGSVTTIVPCSPIISGVIPTSAVPQWTKDDIARLRGIASKELNRLKTRLAEMA